MGASGGFWEEELPSRFHEEAFEGPGLPWLLIFRGC